MHVTSNTVQTEQAALQVEPMAAEEQIAMAEPDRQPDEVVTVTVQHVDPVAAVSLEEVAPVQEAELLAAAEAAVRAAVQE